MTYLERLESLDFSRTLLRPVKRRVLLWTGQSGLAAAGLSAKQKEFLWAVGEDAALLSGFPFHRDCERETDAHLLAASWRNARQTLWCATNQRYRRILAGVLQQAVASTAEKLLLICGSCGLELVNAAAGEWRQTLAPHVSIIALGPTCVRKLCLPRVFAIRGRKDRWSACLYRGPVDAITPGGHLDYWGCEETQRLVRARWLA